MRSITTILAISLLVAASTVESSYYQSVWKECLKLPNITVISTTITTGKDRYIDVRYNGGKDAKTLTFKGNLTLENVNLPEGLRNLTLSRVHLTSIPNNFKWPSSLLSIDLSSNYLTTIPATAPWPASLRSLTLSRNEFSTCISDLPHSLLEFDMSYNHLKTCPWPDHLRKLKVSGNPIKGDCQTWPSKLRHLVIESANLTAVPAGLPQSLEILDLDKNKITTFPSSLPKSIFLLSMCQNLITEIPAQIDTLVPALEDLELDDNKICSIPDGITFPRKFSTLYLGNNSISSLSNSWLKQVKKTLIMFGNRITTIPSGTILPPETNLANNKITALQNIALPKSFNIERNPLERVARITVVPGSMFTTSAARLKEFSVLKSSFPILHDITSGFGFGGLFWTIDLASVKRACDAQLGKMDSLDSMKICVIDPSIAPDYDDVDGEEDDEKETY